jgi:hypothetical protein
MIDRPCRDAPPLKNVDPAINCWATFTVSLRDAIHRRLAERAAILPYVDAMRAHNPLRSARRVTFASLISAKLGSLHCKISIVGIFLSGLQQAVAFLIVANVGVLTWPLARLAAAKRYSGATDTKLQSCFGAS